MRAEVEVVHVHRAVYMWRQKVERQGGDHFEEFLKIIAAKQNQDDPEFDLREV